MKKFAFHLIAGENLVKFAHADYIPCVGDEIRLGPKEFYKVLKAVHCWDEASTIGERVNLLVQRIKL